MMNKTVAIIGAGSWGTALAVMLGKKGIDVNLWVYENEVFDHIERSRENIRYLFGVVIPQNIRVFKNKEEAVQNVELTVLAVPSQLVRSVANEISEYIPFGHIVVNVAKGLESGTFQRL